MSLRPQYDRSFALVIGINDYVRASPLARACGDAESVAEIVTDLLGFPKENVVVLLNGAATRAAIMSYYLGFDSLLPDDRLFVFFAGHGSTATGHRGPVGYLVPVDGNCDDKSTLIRWTQLMNDADLIGAKHILFVMDACYSGLAMQRAGACGAKRFVTDMLQRRSRQVITAGKADEPVADGDGITGNNSIFTSYLLEGLRGKAANEEGVLTASYLMDYVYRKVSTDARSQQTPHFGHLDGEGDFILQTPGGEHLSGRVLKDFLVATIAERPEPAAVVQPSAIRPAFAEKHGYTDPESDTFGRNELTKNLGCFQYSEGRGEQVARPACWLSLIVEPTSNEPVALDIGDLAKTLPNFAAQSSKPYEQMRMPSQSMTNAKSVILYEGDYGRNGSREECWKKFVRIEKNGAIEYCNYVDVAGTFARERLAAGTKVFKYVQLIGIVWSFLFTAKRILALTNYQAGVRYLVNLIGTNDSVLIQFASKVSPDKKRWLEPFDTEAMIGGSLKDWRCRDANLQFPFMVVVGSLGESEGQTLIFDLAEQLGLAYNHKSKPRCFNWGTDVFPWDQFNPHRA